MSFSPDEKNQVTSLLSMYDSWCELCIDSDEDWSMVDSQDEFCYNAAGVVEFIPSLLQEIIYDAIEGIINHNVLISAELLWC